MSFMVSTKKKAKTEDEGTKDGELRLYELGYHLLPTVAEEALGEEVSKLKDAIEKRGGIFVSDEMPKMIQLAYSLPKIISNKRKNFSSAHFGWMRFQMSGEEADKLKRDLEKNKNILRFILLKTVPPKAVLPKRMTFFAPQKPIIQKEMKETKLEEEKVRGREMTEAELDKTIEELIVE